MVTKAFKKRLFLSTALAASFFSYSRRAYAYCYQSSGASYVCTGAETTPQFTNYTNVVVTTQPGFSVNTTTGNGITITGEGTQTFIDNNHSSVTTTDTFKDGLYIRNYDYSNITPAGIIVVSDGSFTGHRDGINAYASGIGGISITLDGSAVGYVNSGIMALAYIQNTGQVSVTTGTGSYVYGGMRGIYASNFGYGDGVSLNLSGEVKGGDGVFSLVKYQGDLTIETYAGAQITGLSGDGIHATNNSAYNDQLSIHTRDTVTGDNRGIYAHSGSSDITITTDAAVTGANTGISADTTSGSLTIHANGDVTGQYTYGISAVVGSGSDGDLYISTGAGHEVKGKSMAIYAANSGSGTTTIVTNGDVTNTFAGPAIYALDTPQGGAMSITTNGYTQGYAAIVARHYGYDNLTVTTNGGVHGDVDVRNYSAGGDMIVNANGNITSYYQAIFARSSAGTKDLTITTSEDSVLDGHNYAGIYALNHGYGDTEVNINGALYNSNHNALHVRNYAGSGGIDVTTGANSKIIGNTTGIYAYNEGYGNTTITQDGYLSAQGAAITAKNTGDDSDIGVTVNGKTYGYSGVYATNASASNTGDTTITVGSKAVITVDGYGIYAFSRSSGKMDITNSGNISASVINGITAYNPHGHGMILNKSGGTISGDSAAIDIRSGGFDQGIINEAGATIEGTGLSGIAIRLSGIHYDTPIIIEGGHVIGDVYDTDRNNGHSLVEIAGDFTSEGDFYVSTLTVDSGKNFTLGENNEIDTYSGVLNQGTLTISNDGSAITGGGLTVDTKALLDVKKNFVVTGETINDGTIKIASGATLTLDTMGSSNGTINFAVSSATDYGKMAVTGGGIDLSSATPVTVTLASGASLTPDTAIMLASGDTAITGAGNPGGTLTSVLTTALWKLEIADGTNTSDGVSDLNGANDLWLHINKNGTMSNLATTSGNANAGNAILSLVSPTSPDLQQLQDDINMAPDADTLNNILERVQPTVNGHIVTAALDNGVRVQGLADNRMIAWREGGEGATGMSAGSSMNGSTVWAQGYGQMAHQGMRDNIAGFTSEMWGSAVGADTERLLKETLVGVSFNYAQVNANALNANRTGTDIESYGFNLYTSTDLGANAFLNGQMGYAYNHIEGVRYDVLAPGDTATATYGSNQFSAKALLGRDYTAPHGLVVTPNISAAYTKLLVDGYTEKGSGGGLSVRRQDYDTLNLGIGFSTYMDIKYAGGHSLKPALHAGYRYAAIADRIDTTASFTADPSNTAFTSVGPTPARSTFDGGMSLTYSLDGAWDLSANYDYTYKQDYHAHAGMARATVHF